MSSGRLFVPVVFVWMLYCSSACERLVAVSLKNETSDTIFAAMSAYSFAPVKYPGIYDPLEEVLPDSQICTSFSSEIIEYHGWHVWIAKKSSIDKYGKDSVINAELYDTVLHYNLDHLEVNDFVIKIHDIDINHNKNINN